MKIHRCVHYVRLKFIIQRSSRLIFGLTFVYYLLWMMEVEAPPAWLPKRKAEATRGSEDKGQKDQKLARL